MNLSNGLLIMIMYNKSLKFQFNFPLHCSFLIVLLIINTKTPKIAFILFAISLSTEKLALFTNSSVTTVLFQAFKIHIIITFYDMRCGIYG